MENEQGLRMLYWLCVLHRLKRHYGLSQKAVAERLRVSPQFLSDIKKGRKVLSDEMAIRTAEAFGFSWDAVARAVSPKLLDYWLAINMKLEQPCGPDEMRLLRRGRKNLIDRIGMYGFLDFPPLNVTHVPHGLVAGEALSGAVVSVPLLTRPAVGDPRRASGYLGEDIPLGGQAARRVARAHHPYLVPLLGEDPARRLTAGDILLIDQNLKHQNEHPIHVIKHVDGLCLARRQADTYQLLGSNAGTYLTLQHVEVATGLVVAIVWSEVLG